MVMRMHIWYVGHWRWGEGLGLHHPPPCMIAKHWTKVSCSSDIWGGGLFISLPDYCHVHNFTRSLGGGVAPPCMIAKHWRKVRWKDCSAVLIFGGLFIKSVICITLGGH